MNFWKDYLGEVLKAFWEALAVTDTLVIGVLIVAGIGSVWLGGHAEHPSWQIAFSILLISLVLLLVRMPYRLYAEQRALIGSLNQRLTRISEDRPFRFNGISTEKWVRRNPAYGPWAIERIGLEFENVGDQALDWKITKFRVEYQQNEKETMLPVDGRYHLHARETMVLGVDVSGLEVMIFPIGNPTTVRISFCVEYDNVIPLRVRKIKRVIDYRIRNLVLEDYYTDIVEQGEW